MLVFVIKNSAIWALIDGSCKKDDFFAFSNRKNADQIACICM